MMVFKLNQYIPTNSNGWNMLINFEFTSFLKDIITLRKMEIVQDLDFLCLSLEKSNDIEYNFWIKPTCYFEKVDTKNYKVLYSVPNHKSYEINKGKEEWDSIINKLNKENK